MSCVKLSFANDYEFKILSPFTGNLDCTWKESSLQTLIEDSMWLVDPVEDSYDPTGGLPADPTVGDRYISDATANGWTIDYIYEWDGTSWVESIPEEGWMVWMLLDLLYYVFFSGGWMEVGAGSYLSLDGESINVTNGTFDLTTTGDISVGGVTVTSLTDGIATLTGGALSGSTIADGTTMATNGAPVADAGIANKKYVDDVVVAAGGAPIDATYITQTANGTLTAEQALTSLSDGIVKVNGTTGVLSTAIADTDYDSSTTNEINTITGDDSNSTTGLGITVAGSGINATTVAGNTVTVTATEADTLDTVSDRGSTTDQSITTGGYSDGIATLTGGALTGATGNISMFTNDSAYLTTLPFAGLSDYPANASGALTNDGAGALSWVVPAGSGDLKADGSVPLTADWNVGLFDITAVEFKGALIGNANTVTNGVYTTDFPLNQDTTGKADTAGNADTVTNATLTTALTVNTGTLTLTAAGANTSVLTLAAGASSIEGTNTGDNTVCTSGAATTAETLKTARAINGVDFDGSAAITVTAAAGTLTGATLKSSVLASSLTSLGTIASLVATTADIDAGTFDGTVGGTTPADGSFSTLSASSTITGMTDIYTVAWADYGLTSTIVGFSSYSTQIIRTKKIGKTVFVSFWIDGTSDTTGLTFTVPYTSTNDVITMACCYTSDSGSAATGGGRISLPNNSAVVTCYSDMAAASWTASGNKIVFGQFFYESA